MPAFFGLDDDQGLNVMSVALIPSEPSDPSSRLSSEDDDGIIHLIRSQPRRIGSRHIISSVDCYVPAFFGLDDDQALNVMSDALIPSEPPDPSSCLLSRPADEFMDDFNGIRDFIPSQLGSFGPRPSFEDNDGITHLIRSEHRRIGIFLLAPSHSVLLEATLSMSLFFSLFVIRYVSDQGRVSATPFGHCLSVLHFMSVRPPHISSFFRLPFSFFRLSG